MPFSNLKEFMDSNLNDKYIDSFGMLIERKNSITIGTEKKNATEFCIIRQEALTGLLDQDDADNLEENNVSVILTNKEKDVDEKYASFDKYLNFVQNKNVTVTDEELSKLYDDYSKDKEQFIEGRKAEMLIVTKAPNCTLFGEDLYLLIYISYNQQTLATVGYQHFCHYSLSYGFSNIMSFDNNTAENNDINFAEIIDFESYKQSVNASESKKIANA